MIGNGVQDLAHFEGLVFNCFAASRNLRRKRIHLEQFCRSENHTHAVVNVMKPFPESVEIF